ncbi:MAG: hypothetical protein B7X11_04665, partial [Acidobacteria bacterium 37-65-4]
MILLVFIAAGTIAFQFSAPPAKEGRSGFSFSKLIDSARRGMRGTQSYTAPPRTLTFAVGPDVTQLSIAGSAAGPVKILGEVRNDISLELTVASTGENEAAAIAIANRTTVSEDRVGSLL